MYNRKQFTFASAVPLLTTLQPPTSVRDHALLFYAVVIYLQLRQHATNGVA